MTQVDGICAHHWMIEQPTAEMSRGVCKHCGAVRSFQNEPSRPFYVSSRKAPAPPPPSA